MGRTTYLTRPSPARRRSLACFARRLLLLAVPLALAAGVASAASREEIDARVQGALEELYERTPAARELSRKASGILVFPRVIKAGFGVGVTSHRLARRNPNLERLLPDFESSLDLWVVAHETVRKSARVRAAFDHIIAQMQADGAYFTRGEASIL